MSSGIVGSCFRRRGGPVEADQVGGAVKGAEPEPAGHVLDVPGLVVEPHRRVRGQGGRLDAGVGAQADSADEVGQGDTSREYPFEINGVTGLGCLGLQIPVVVGVHVRDGGQHLAQAGAVPTRRPGSRTTRSLARSRRAIKDSRGDRASWISDGFTTPNCGFTTPSCQEVLSPCPRPAVITRSSLPAAARPSGPGRRGSYSGRRSVRPAGYPGAQRDEGAEVPDARPRVDAARAAQAVVAREEGRTGGVGVGHGLDPSGPPVVDEADAGAAAGQRGERQEFASEVLPGVQAQSTGGAVGRLGGVGRGRGQGAGRACPTRPPTRFQWLPGAFGRGERTCGCLRRACSSREVLRR